MGSVDSLTKSTLGSQVNEVFVLRQKGEFFYETRPQPDLPTSKHVLVKIIATGICGSDVHYWRHGEIGPFKVTQPIILGHESAGIVVQCGSDVQSLRVNDRVAVEPGVGCRTCNYCRSGKYNLCEGMCFAATPPYDGTLATYYVVPEDFCYLLPETISIEEGALVEPLSIAVHVAKLAPITTGQAVLVLGAGPIGLLCCAVAKAFGASKIVAVDIVESRLEFASGYAATSVYKMDTKQSAEQNADILAGDCNLRSGADVVIDATGVQSCISCGIHSMKRGGIFIQAGLGNSEITFPVGQICSKEGTYKGSFRYGPGDYDLAVELLRSGKVSVKELITHKYSFLEAEKAFAGTARAEGIKTIIYGPQIQSS